MIKSVFITAFGVREKNPLGSCIFFLIFWGVDLTFR